MPSAAVHLRQQFAPRADCCFVVQPDKGVVTPVEEPFVQRIIQVARSFEGKEPSITPIGGGTLPLLGALKRHVGVPGLSAPGDPAYWASGAHSPNEHVRLEDVARAVAFNRHMFLALGENA